MVLSLRRLASRRGLRMVSVIAGRCLSVCAALTVIVPRRVAASTAQTVGDVDPAPIVERRHSHAAKMIFIQANRSPEPAQTCLLTV